MNNSPEYEPGFKCGTFKTDKENGISAEIRARMDKDREIAALKEVLEEALEVMYALYGYMYSDVSHEAAMKKIESSPIIIRIKECLESNVY